MGYNEWDREWNMKSSEIFRDWNMILQTMAHFFGLSGFAFPGLPQKRIEKETITAGYSINSKPPTQTTSSQLAELSSNGWHGHPARVLQDSTTKLRRFCFLFYRLFAFWSCCAILRPSGSWSILGQELASCRCWNPRSFHFIYLLDLDREGRYCLQPWFKWLGTSEIQGCLPQIDLWMQPFETVMFPRCVWLCQASMVFLRLDALPVLMYTCHGRTKSCLHVHKKSDVDEAVPIFHLLKDGSHGGAFFHCSLPFGVQDMDSVSCHCQLILMSLIVNGIWNHQLLIPQTLQDQHSQQLGCMSSHIDFLENRGWEPLVAQFLV